MQKTDNVPGPTFSRRFWPLYLAGLLGVVSLAFTILPAVQTRAAFDGLPDLPTPALVALMLINPAILLAISAALGAWLVPKLGWTSLLAGTGARTESAPARLWAAAPLAIALGLGFAVVTAIIDAALQPWLSEAWLQATAAANREGGPGAVLVGLLYGGITEEIMLRWGAMSLVAWIIWRVAQSTRSAPSDGAVWTAIVVAALLFGLGHLPAAAQLAPLDAALVLRTVGLNALGGLVFGWLFWRRHLEAAMLAHASTHIGFALLALAGVL